LPVKKLLKKLLLPILTSQPISAFATPLTGLGVPIFMLHRMYPDSDPGQTMTPGYLRQCLQYLKSNGYSFVSLEDIFNSIREQQPLPRKCVAFTIDDGFIDQATLAAPVFAEFECPATIFLISGFLDNHIWPWYSQVEYMLAHCKVANIELELPDKKLKFAASSDKEKQQTTWSLLEEIKTINWRHVPQILQDLSRATQVIIPDSAPEDSKAMSWEMARTLEKSGIRFGPHTVTHPILAKVDDQQSRNEITQSWQRLNDELAYPSPIFCYPNGELKDFGQREIDIVRDSGFIGAVSTVPKQVDLNSTTHDYLFKLPRYGLPKSFLDFKSMCSWVEHVKEKLRA